MLTEVEQYERWVKWVRENRYRYMSQYTMAKDLGITQPTLSRILSGKRTGKRTFQKAQNAK